MMSSYSIRIIILDSYMSTPTQGLDVMYSEFRGSAINQVPILRLFGSTETGEKICLHIHGVFPYLYIPYDGSEDVNSLMYQVAARIDKGVNISLNQASSNAQHVYKVSLVSGIPMYGYHSKSHQFLKIHLYNPLLIRRVSDLLMNDTTLGKLYQPHETHVPFALQFMIDYNLHGMSNLILSNIKFRIDTCGLNPNINPELVLPTILKKVSVCEIEADALAEHILNRLEIASGNIGINPGIAALWADEMQRRRNKDETSQIEHLLELKHINVEPTKSHSVLKQALLERLAITSIEKNVVNEKLNMSIYPIETPEHLNIQNASLIDSQSPLDLDLSLDETLTSADIHDANTSGQLNETMDEDAQALLKILQNLEANAKVNVEEDSILSQVVKENEEDKEFDLSMPLESVTTPKKVFPNHEGSDCDDDDMLDTTLIPQLDGECDTENEDFHEQFVINNKCDRRITRSFTKLLNDLSKNKIAKQHKLIKKALYVKLIRMDNVKKGRHMPLLYDDFDLNLDVPFTTNETISKPAEANECKVADFLKNITEENKSNIIKTTRLKRVEGYQDEHERMAKKTVAQLKSWEFQIKTFKRTNRLIRTIKKIHSKENKICIMLSKNRIPAFKIIPGSKYRKTKQDLKFNIISEIMLKTKYHIDPDLHLTLQYPSKETFLYVYNKNMYPNVTKIPNKLMRSGKEQMLKRFINHKTMKTGDDNNQNNFKQEKEEALMLKQTSCINAKDKCDYSKEFLRNNYVTSSRSFCNVLLKDYNNFEGNVFTRNNAIENCQNQIKNGIPQDEQLQQMQFSPEIMYSNNESHSYIFSAKYLTNIDNDNLINNIKNQSMDQIKETMKLIKKELQKHVLYLKEPIGNNSKISMNDELSNIYFTNPKEENCTTEKNNQHVKDFNKNHVNEGNIVRNIFSLNTINHGESKNIVSSQCSTETTNGILKKKLNNSLKPNKRKPRQNTVPYTLDPFKSKPIIELKRCVFLNGIKCSTETTNEILKKKDNNSLKSSKRKPRQKTVPYTLDPFKCKPIIELKRCVFLDGMKCSTETTNGILKKKDNTSLKFSKRKPRQKTVPYTLDPFKPKPIVELKRCVFLDGTVDSSSSSEEENNTLKRKRTSRKKFVSNLSRYSALPITFCNSPVPKSQEYPSDKHLVSQNTIKNIKENEASIIKYNLQQSVCDNAKRKLNFSNTSLQTTVVEEKIVCSYSPCKSQKKVVCELNRNKIVDCQKTKFIQCNKVESELDCTSVNMDHVLNSGRGDILFDWDSEDAEADRSFFRSPQISKKLNLLTTAEKYDKETNYSAKEGTSKVFNSQPRTSSQKSSEEVYHSSGSSSFGLLTPYQQVAEESSHLKTLCENENQNKNPEDDANELLHTISFTEISVNSKDIPSKILIPIKKAPTRDQVSKSLDNYNIPSVKQVIPFYSNIDDVTGSVEVGYNVLKIISNTTAHLAEFESQTDSINDFRKLKMKNMSSNLEWKKSNVNNLALSFCKDRYCIIEPMKKPPSLTIVKKWITGKSKKAVTPEKQIEKIKIFVPLSPGNNANEDDDINISLTISPCTPVNSQHNSDQSIISSQTPKSSKTSGSSLILGRERRKRNEEIKQKLSQSITPSLRKSLLVSQDKSSSINSCQITGVSPNNTYAFDHSTENLQAARAVIEHQHLTVLVMEMHIRTRGEFKPNPEYDSIRAIFYSILNDVPANHQKASKCKGAIAINSLPLSPNTRKVPILDGAGVNCDITYVDSEDNLLNEFSKLVEYWNPDILAGYEIQLLSWGYLIDRASVLGINYKSLLSRIKKEKKYKDERDQNELQITGRIVLDVWRLLRHEIALQSYTFESVIYHILHKRVAQYSFKDLSFWWDHRSALYRYRTVHYYLFRVETILELFDKLDIIGRTSELARLFGIQFFEVLSRGSQFRVESMMLRLAKPLNFIPVSPSVQQRAQMRAPEYIPLVLEPESKLYNDPVIVLDFQSLYPSIIIAYNYCFTTCLGKVECLGKNTPFEFGATQLKVSRRYLEKFLKKDLLNFSPCGVGFVKKEVRDGILPRMLREILDTRLMVKDSMKQNKEDRLLQKVLHNRQLGLKLIANVTYGYTAANFSGRMPSVEVADSVVSKGRETLQRAIEMVDNTPEWGARVVYGDTDSLFVLVPGKSRQHAFEVGKNIADAVTKANPDPIKLKLEKVYQPCILQTKKRYVGYMYESPDQKDPVYDAKGIETVRRDGCPAVSKMLEKCLRLLFETKDISFIKKYVLRQFHKIIAGRASIQDLTFAKEYRGASGYRPGACVPALELARKWTAVDKRNEPRRGERVPYIIVNGPPGLPLIRMVKSPRDLLNDPSLRPNALYYITKVIIPPINRCFNLIGADVNAWFNQMPRKQIQSIPSSVSPGKKSTISHYFSTTSCVTCGEQTQTGICSACLGKPQITTVTLMEKLRIWEKNNYNCNLICQSCSGVQSEVRCVSLDCPVLYKRIQTNRDLQQTTHIRELMSLKEFLF